MAREYPTGATRSDASKKPDYEGYLSPTVLIRFGEYMLAHQYQGQRSSDNWQKGIPQEDYLKSLLRHVIAAWWAHREGRVDEEAWCAILFNAQGYLHESLTRPSRGV